MKASGLVSVAAICAGLYGCGGGDNGTPVSPAPPSSPAPPASLTLSSHDVYVLTQAQSETDDPLKVNFAGGSSISGTDETSDPMAVE